MKRFTMLILVAGICALAQAERSVYVPISLNRAMYDGTGETVTVRCRLIAIGADDQKVTVTAVDASTEVDPSSNKYAGQMTGNTLGTKTITVPHGIGKSYSLMYGYVKGGSASWCSNKFPNCTDGIPSALYFDVDEGPGAVSAHCNMSFSSSSLFTFSVPVNGGRPF